MQATHICPTQRNYVVNRHVHTPCLGVDGIDDLPIRPSGSLLLASRLSEAISLPDLIAVPQVFFAVIPLKAIWILDPSIALPRVLLFPAFGMAASLGFAFLDAVLIPLPVKALGKTLFQQEPLVFFQSLPAVVLTHIFVAARHTRP